MLEGMVEQMIYGDMVGNITLNNGMVRIDLYREALPGEETQDPGGAALPQEGPRYTFCNRLVMPVVGFVQSYPLFHDIIRQMEEQGAIKVQETTT